MKVKNPFYLKLMQEQSKTLKMDGRVVYADYKFWKYLAKATGLKSNKQRHILKRAKSTFIKLIMEGINEETTGN